MLATTGAPFGSPTVKARIPPTAAATTSYMGHPRIMGRRRPPPPEEVSGGDNTPVVPHTE